MKTRAILQLVAGHSALRIRKNLLRLATRLAKDMAGGRFNGQSVEMLLLMSDEKDRQAIVKTLITRLENNSVEPPKSGFQDYFDRLLERLKTKERKAQGTRHKAQGTFDDTISYDKVKRDRDSFSSTFSKSKSARFVQGGAPGTGRR